MSAPFDSQTPAEINGPAPAPRGPSPPPSAQGMASPRPLTSASLGGPQTTALGEAQGMHFAEIAKPATTTTTVDGVVSVDGISSPPRAGPTGSAPLHSRGGSLEPSRAALREMLSSPNLAPSGPSLTAALDSTHNATPVAPPVVSFAVSSTVSSKMALETSNGGSRASLNEGPVVAAYTSTRASSHGGTAGLLTGANQEVSRTVSLGLSKEAQGGSKRETHVVADTAVSTARPTDSGNASLRAPVPAAPRAAVSVLPSSPPPVLGPSVTPLKTLSCYSITKQLGEGSFGTVKQATNSQGQLVALKQMLHKNNKDGFPVTSLREIHIMRKLRHRNVLLLIEMLYEPGDPLKKTTASWFMAMPYMSHDLAGVLANPRITLAVPQLKCLLRQVLQGLQYIHEQRFFHRDIKTANLLLDFKGTLKIADLGLARPYKGKVPVLGGGPAGGDGRYTGLVVTRWYRPPELLLGERSYTTAVDLWGVGCVFGEMYEKTPILKGPSDTEQAYYIFNLVGGPTAENWPRYKELPGNAVDLHRGYPSPTLRRRFGGLMDPIAMDLMERFLTLDPLKRYNALDGLNHEWFRTQPLACAESYLTGWEDSHEQDKKRFEAETKSVARPLPPPMALVVPPTRGNPRGETRGGSRGGRRENGRNVTQGVSRGDNRGGAQSTTRGSFNGATRGPNKEPNRGPSREPNRGSNWETARGSNRGSSRGPLQDSKWDSHGDSRPLLGWAPDQLWRAADPARRDPHRDQDHPRRDPHRDQDHPRRDPHRVQDHSRRDTHRDQDHSRRDPHRDQDHSRRDPHRVQDESRLDALQSKPRIAPGEGVPVAPTGFPTGPLSGPSALTTREDRLRRFAPAEKRPFTKLLYDEPSGVVNGSRDTTDKNAGSRPTAPAARPRSPLTARSLPSGFRPIGPRSSTPTEPRGTAPLRPMNSSSSHSGGSSTLRWDDTRSAPERKRHQEKPPGN